MTLNLKSGDFFIFKKAADLPVYRPWNPLSGLFVLIAENFNFSLQSVRDDGFELAFFAC